MLRSSIDGGAAYQWGSLGLFFAAAVILTALGFEYMGGYRPCPLCLQQRWAYYAGIPLTFAALVLLSTQRPRSAAVLFVIVALIYLGNAGLGVYHAGAEWKLWPGPDTCAAPGGQASTGTGTLLDRLRSTTVIRCDEAPLRVAGLSFAGWNVVACLMLSTISIKAAWAAPAYKRYL